MLAGTSTVTSSSTVPTMQTTGNSNLPPHVQIDLTHKYKKIYEYDTALTTGQKPSELDPTDDLYLMIYPIFHYGEHFVVPATLTTACRFNFQTLTYFRDC